MKVRITRCTKVEFCGTKNDAERVIATVSRRDGDMVVESVDPEVRQELIQKLPRLQVGLVFGTKKHGVHRDWELLQAQDDPFYLEALCGPQLDLNTIAGYKWIWGRAAGKTWVEEIEVREPA